MKFLLILITFLSSALSQELSLLNNDLYKPGAYLSKIKKDTTGSLSVSIPSRKQWPSASLVCSDEQDFYNYDLLKVRVNNLSSTDQVFHISVKDHQGKSTGTQQEISAGETSTIELKLKRKDDLWKSHRLFGMRTLPWMERLKEPADLHNVKSIAVSIEKSKEPFNFRIESALLSGEYKPLKLPKPFFPLVDKYGQYKHKEWNRKITSDEQLKSLVEQENLGNLSKSKFGSFESSQSFDAKGHFYTKKVNKKWIIVDPEGKPFYSMGMNSVNFSRKTPYTSRKHWFEVSSDNEFIQPTTNKTVHGFFKGKKIDTIDFLQSNLRLKYGNNYKDKIVDRTIKRFQSWGVNTIGAWSSKSLYGKKHPYTIIIQPWSRGLDSSSGSYGKFPDVFDKDFTKNIEEAVLGIGKKSLEDPFCLGIFIHNELPWGDDTNFAYWSLNSYGYQPAKKAFIEDLKLKFDSIEQLNKSWGSNFQSWDILLKNPYSPNYQKASKELISFSKKYAERYFKVCRNAIRKHATGRLYLGCRFAYNNKVASAAAVKYCDIVSVNLYYPHSMIGNYTLPGQEKDAVPLLIGEFHFGSRDRGFAKGLRGGETQEERTQMMASYIESSIEHPGFVGSHWFQMYDQPVTGRVLDGENYQVGFVDISDTPYEMLIKNLKRIMTKSSKKYLPENKN